MHEMILKEYAAFIKGLVNVLDFLLGNACREYSKHLLTEKNFMMQVGMEGLINSVIGYKESCKPQ